MCSMISGVQYPWGDKFEKKRMNIWQVGITYTRTKIVSEYDQEIPQSQTADNPVAPRGRAAQPPRDTRKTN